MIVRNKTLAVLLKKIRTLPDQEWQRLLKEMAESVITQQNMVSAQVDGIIYRRYTEPSEFEKYQKMKKIKAKGSAESIRIAEKARLTKKQLERFVGLLILEVANDEVTSLSNQVEFNEFGEALTIVNRRLGFSNDWLVYLALIQLHENLIKKKIAELGGRIEGNDKMPELVSRLSQLIRDNEGRDISLALLMSNGIKNARDTMTHDGYRRAVSKADLRKLNGEIADLERVLYPGNGSQTQ